MIFSRVCSRYPRRGGIGAPPIVGGVSGRPPRRSARGRVTRRRPEVILTARENQDMPLKAADALLFDLGRVVIDIDIKRPIACWAVHARCDPRLIEERLRRDISHHRHEVGEIDMAAYFAGLKA